MESESWAVKGSEHLAVSIDAVMMQSKNTALSSLLNQAVPLIGDVRATLNKGQCNASDIAKCSILKILLEWRPASLTEEPLLEKCCSWVLHLTLKPDWLDAATSAFREAEALISTAGQKWASQHWANSGSEEVAVVLGACPYLPSQLQDILVLAKHSSLLQNIPEVKLFLKEEDQVKDFGWLVKYTKKWLSLKTMDMDSIATYFDPATVDKVKRFMSHE